MTIRNAKLEPTASAPPKQSKEVAREKPAPHPVANHSWAQPAARPQDVFVRLPLPPPPSTPVVPSTPAVRVGGVGLVGDNAVSEVATQEAKSILAMLTWRPDIAAKLEAAKVNLVIIPRNVKMTDLPEFASLRGQTTFDGRRWEDVRGVGYVRTPDGRVAIGVSEENLAEQPGDAYAGNFSVGMHELAHVIHFEALSKSEVQQIDQAYDGRKAAGGPWTEEYASSNAYEYFAQGTNAYFGRNDGIGHNGAGWVRENDPPLYGILEGVYGPSR